MSAKFNSASIVQSGADTSTGVSRSITPSTRVITLSPSPVNSTNAVALCLGQHIHDQLVLRTVRGNHGKKEKLNTEDASRALRRSLESTGVQVGVRITSCLLEQQRVIAGLAAVDYSSHFDHSGPAYSHASALTDTLLFHRRSSRELAISLVSGPLWHAMFGRRCKTVRYNDEDSPPLPGNVAQLTDPEFPFGRRGLLKKKSGGSANGEMANLQPELEASDFLAYTCGVISGALSSVGYTDTQVSYLPICKQLVSEASVLKGAIFYLDFRGRKSHE